MSALRKAVADEEYVTSDSIAHPSMKMKAPGARFFKEVNRAAIMKIEFDEVLTGFKIFEFVGVHAKPLVVENPDYYPHPGCIFDVLREPDNDVRATELKEYFEVLATPGHVSESVGLFYTILHLWKLFYFYALTEERPEAMATANYFIKAGVLQSMMRVIARCFDRTFFMKEYNRLVPYRALEVVFAATQSTNQEHDWYVDIILDESCNTYDTLRRMITGEITSVEQIMACQVVGNISYTYNGTRWLIEHPVMMGKLAYFLWGMYDLTYTSYTQYEERRIFYMTQQCFTKIRFIDPDDAYDVYPLTTWDIHMFHVICSLCNVCAAHPDDEPMERIEPALLCCVKEGLFDHAGTILCGTILNDTDYRDQTLEKFLSFFSWSTFQIEAQHMLIEQLRSRPTHRCDKPLLFDRDRDSKSNSVLAILNTHTIHMDYEKGSNFVTLAMVFLLRDDDIAMEVIRWIGDTLFDLAHSTFHAPMPDIKDKPSSVKRVVFETMLRFGGISFFNEDGNIVKPSEKRFDEPIPECVHEARAFCDRNMKEMKLSRFEKQKRVRCADEFKAEGNKFFTKKKYYSAIKSYTKSLEICPLTCTERRVTYYSNRAECYLKTNQSYRAMRDCNKALAMNPTNLRTRWRRAQAFQNMNKRYAAALDLFSIKHNMVEAKAILTERLYADLDKMINDLLDAEKFFNLAPMMHGPSIVLGGTEKEGAVNEENVTSRHCLPVFTGKYYHELFEMKPGEYSK